MRGYTHSILGAENYALNAPVAWAPPLRSGIILGLLEYIGARIPLLTAGLDTGGLVVGKGMTAV